MQENEAVNAVIYLIKSITQDLISEVLTYLPYLIRAVIIALLFIVGHLTVKRIFKK